LQIVKKKMKKMLSKKNERDDVPKDPELRDAAMTTVDEVLVEACRVVRTDSS